MQLVEIKSPIVVKTDDMKCIALINFIGSRITPLHYPKALKISILTTIFFLLSPLFSAANEDYRDTTIELQGEVLVWTLYQRNMSPANTPQPIFTTNQFQGSKIDNVQYSWRPGYRLSGFYDVFFGEVGARFTSYQGSLNQRFTTSPTQGFYPLFTMWEDQQPSDYTRFSYINGKVDLWMIDAFAVFNLVSEDILIYPKVGVRNIWINQNYDTTYDGGTFVAGTDSIQRTSNYYGIGPQVGVTGFYHLFSHLFFTGEALVTWYAGTFKDIQTEIFLTRTLRNQSFHRTYGRFSVDLQGGFEWVSSFFNDKWMVGLDAGGDWIFFNNGSNNLPANGTNLYFTGVHGGLKLAF